MNGRSLNASISSRDGSRKKWYPFLVSLKAIRLAPISGKTLLHIGPLATKPLSLLEMFLHMLSLVI